MNLETPEGQLTIDDDKLTFKPGDDGQEYTVSLSPMPEYEYQRGVYGLGTLVIDGEQITLTAEQATKVVEELRRPRADVTKTTRKSDSDTATVKSDAATK